MAHYDVNKKTKIRTDGSKLNGISAILYQESEGHWRPVAFASRYLSTEKNYHNIEIEMLAVAWGCEKMAKYVLGLQHFLVETDHKPLIPILNTKPLNDMSARIQRMRMQLLKFNFTAAYVKGSDLADADALSRAPVDQPTKQDELAEQDIAIHVEYVLQQMPASEKRLQEIKVASSKDRTLQKVIDYLKTGWPEQKKECDQETHPYWNGREDGRKAVVLWVE